MQASCACIVKARLARANSAQAGRGRERQAERRHPDGAAHGPQAGGRPRREVFRTSGMPCACEPRRRLTDGVGAVARPSGHGTPSCAGATPGNIAAGAERTAKGGVLQRWHRTRTQSCDCGAVRGRSRRASQCGTYRCGEISRKSASASRRAAHGSHTAIGSRGRSPSPAGVGVLPCTGVWVPLYRGFIFPCAGAQGEQTRQQERKKK